MSPKQQTIEERAATVEEAVEAGLEKLGLSEDRVDIDIIDEGRRGLLGIGGREAIVRLSVRSEPAKSESIDKPAAPTKTTTAVDEKPIAAKPTPVTAPKSDAKVKTQTPPSTADRTEATSVKAIIQAMLEKMSVEASVETSVSEPDELTGRQLTVVNITGDDLGLLIGPRGETLDALQHVSRLMVGHEIRQRANFVIDIDGYREKREQALARMAERMGQKAIDRGSPVTLEPMPAFERRIIHITLRENPQVRTESTGEGGRRRVRIYPE